MDYRKIVYTIGEEEQGKTVLTFLKARGYSSRVLGAPEAKPLWNHHWEKTCERIKATEKRRFTDRAGSQP